MARGCVPHKICHPFSQTPLVMTVKMQTGENGIAYVPDLLRSSLGR